MDELLKSVKKTKDYAKIYGQNLNDDQLFLRLISPKVYGFKMMKGLGIPGTENAEWHNKICLTKKFVKTHLCKMKGIKMVGITGTVAAESAKEGEDIDLLIVTKEDELWWWRLYLRFYIWWNKIPHRKFGEKEKENEFCFNLWLDTANLEMPANKRNLKNATDLVMMKIILDRDNTYQKFLKKNKWVKKYLATGYQERNERLDFKIKKTIKKEKNNFGKKIISQILFWGQYLYMWSKTKKRLKNVSCGQAFFHEDD